MDRVINGTLTAVLRREIQDYAGDVATPVGESQFFYTENPDKQIFCITVPYLSSELPASLLLMAHIEDDQIVIDVDTMDKPLADALRQAGIPSEQIILAWQNH
jgi:hypothetical protein